MASGPITMSPIIVCIVISININGAINRGESSSLSKEKKINNIESVTPIKNNHYKIFIRIKTGSHLKIDGNLQDTMTRTELNNVGKTTHEQNTKGVLWWCLGKGVDLICVEYHFVKKKNTMYITW